MIDMSRMQDWPDLTALGLLVALNTSAKSIGQAATEVGVAQPNASRSLRVLERELRVPLLVRSPRGSDLTHEGRAVAEWAAEVIEAYANLNAGTRAIQDARAGTVRIRASLTVAEYLLPAHLATLHVLRPDIDVGLVVENSASVITAVRAGKCDLGLIESATAPAGLPATTIGHDRLLIAAAHGYAGVWRTPVGAEELARVPLLVREAGSGTRDVVDACLAGAGGVAEAGVYASNSALKIAASTAVAPVVLSELALREELRSGALEVLPIDESVDLRRTLRAIWSPRRRMTPGARAVLDHIVAAGRRDPAHRDDARRDPAREDLERRDPAR